MNVEVRYGAYIGKHTLQVVEGDGPPLLGRDWLKDIHLDWASIRTLSIQTSATPPSVEKLLEKYPALSSVPTWSWHNEATCAPQLTRRQ